MFHKLMDNLTKDIIEEVNPHSDGDQIIVGDMFEGGLINHVEVEDLQLEVSRFPKGSTYCEDPILPNSIDCQLEKSIERKEEGHRTKLTSTMVENRRQSDEHQPRSDTNDSQTHFLDDPLLVKTPTYSQI